MLLKNLIKNISEDKKKTIVSGISMNSKDVKVTLGPTVNLNNLHIKRIKRKSVQLVRKPKK